MAGVLIGIGALLVLLAAMPMPAPATSAPLKRILASGNPKAIAAAAVEVHKSGNPAAAERIYQHAKNVAVVTPAATYTSPFPGVGNEPWTLFVRALRGQNAKAITPNYYLGLFGFGMRRLVDMGLARNPAKMEWQGKQVWGAEWLPAYSPGPDKFLANPELQYRTFVKSMVGYGKQIATELREVIGSTLDGDPVTLSGLLAVAKQAGFDGLRKWIASEEVRAEHRTTTAQFHKLNGLF